jgi:hypothetical protein
MLSALIVAAGLATLPRGTVEGTVVQKGDHGEKPAVHRTVQLKIYKENYQSASAQTQTDSAGRYRFSNLQTESEFYYEPVALIDGVPFTAPPVQFVGSRNVQARKITVGAVTGDLSALNAQEVILIEFGNADLMKMSHSFTFTNVGTATYDYRAGKGEYIRISLPAQGYNLSLGGGLEERDVDIGDQSNLHLKLNIPPGEASARRAEFSYLLPYTASSLDFVQKMNVKLDALAFATQGRKIDIEGSGIRFEQEKERDGKKYFLYRGDTLPADAPLQLSFKGLPRSGDLAHRILFGGVFAITAIAGFLLWRTSKETVAPSKTDAREKALGELIKLEERLRTGLISAQEYHEERDRLRDFFFDLDHAA